MIDNVMRFVRSSPEGMETTQPATVPSLHEDYRDLVVRELGRLGVPEEMLDVEIVSFGYAPDGRETYGALLKLVAWERAAVARLLLGPALLEMKVRKAISESWLPQVSLFAGLWVRVSSRLTTGEAGSALKDMLATVIAPVGDAPVRRASGMRNAIQEVASGAR